MRWKGHARDLSGQRERVQWFAGGSRKEWLLRHRAGGCAEIHIKFALRRPTQLARFTERLFEHLAMNLVYLVMLHVNATSRSVPGLTTDHDVAHCAYFSAFRAGSRNLLRKEPKARLIPGARPSGAGFALGSESQVRCSLAGGGRRFRTIGPAVKETAVQGGPRPTIVPSLDNLCAAGLICTSRRKALGPHARSSIPCGDNRASILGPSAPPSATIKAEIPTFQMRIITLASIS